MVKLSLVIPVYNVEQYLGACLASCVDPSRAGEYEIIAVNDGATDASGRILAEQAARYPELIRTVTTENGGLGHARNTGLSLAQGDFVAFLDSDDTLAPGALGEMLDCLDDGYDITFFDFVAVNEFGRRLAETKGCPGEEGSFTLAERPEIIFGPANAVNKLWRRRLFTDSGIRFPDRLWFEDLATAPKLYLHADRMRYLPREWYVYLQRGGSITNSAQAGRNREMIPVIDSVLEYYRAAGAYERWEKELCYLAFFHELLTSGTRVSQIDPKSPVLDELLEDFLRRFPDFQRNPYVCAMPSKYRMLTELILRRRRSALRAVMRANAAVRRKHR